MKCLRLAAPRRVEKYIMSVMLYATLPPARRPRGSHFMCALRYVMRQVCVHPVHMANPGSSSTHGVAEGKSAWHGAFARCGSHATNHNSINSQTVPIARTLVQRLSVPTEANFVPHRNQYCRYPDPTPRLLGMQPPQVPQKTPPSRGHGFVPWRNFRKLPALRPTDWCFGRSLPTPPIHRATNGLSGGPSKFGASASVETVRSSDDASRWPCHNRNAIIMCSTWSF